jgi:AraC-like DNA-binding protein
MRWFVPSAPSPDLETLLACQWSATSAGRHELIPDGSIELLWIEGGGGAWLCGPDTHGWGFDLPAGTAMSGVRFRPGAGAAVLGLDACAVRDVRLPLADVLGAATDRIVAERLAEAGGPAERRRVLESLVRRRMAEPSATPTADLAALVASDPGHGVEQLAETTGISSRQLRRRFDRDVGYGPAFFARIARLQRFARAAASGPRRGLAELAVVAGYVDQSHLAKDCRALAGMTPRELVTTLPRTSVAVRSIQDAGGAPERRWAA